MHLCKSCKHWKGFIAYCIYEEQLRDSEGGDFGAPPQVCFYSYNLIYYSQLL
jgi:hypothetical protein